MPDHPAGLTLVGISLALGFVSWPESLSLVLIEFVSDAATVFPLVLALAELLVPELFQFRDVFFDGGGLSCRGKLLLMSLLTSSIFRAASNRSLIDAYLWPSNGWEIDGFMVWSSLFILLPASRRPPKD